MKKILLVDDDPHILAAFQRQLRRELSIETALGAEQGLTALESGDDYAVLITDMQMPGMSGVEFLRRVKARSPDIVRIMLTGNADQDTAVEAINDGAIFRLLLKPCPTDRLVTAIRAGIRQHELITAERELLEKTLRGCVKMLSDILVLTAPELFSQAERIRVLALALGKYMKLARLWELEVAALLSHIGNIAVPPDLNRRCANGDSLADAEVAILERVPLVGSRLLANVPRMEDICKTILYQNKRFDGGGFPSDSLVGTRIPLHARILKVVSDIAQEEKTAGSCAVALERLRRHEHWYDPDILDLAGKCFDNNIVGMVPKRAEAPPVKAIRFADLSAGCELATDVQTLEGMPIVIAGTVITEPLLQRLQNFKSLTGLKEPILVRVSN